MPSVYLNAISTAVPLGEMHQRFIDFVPKFINDAKTLTLFNRMVKRAHIDRRYSVLRPHANPDKLDDNDFYLLNQFPSTGQRMQAYQQHALGLAQSALDPLQAALLGAFANITHLVTTSCTGFYAPGLDCDILALYQLNPAVERTHIGFMGCYAAVNALKTAWHIVRSQPSARVLVLNLELCTLHFNQTQNLESLLSFLLFADGCAASLISADPVGIELNGFACTILPDCADQITWTIGDYGFDMILSGKVPASINQYLPQSIHAFIGEKTLADIKHWAIHPGGRSIIDAVGNALQLPDDTLVPSREVLRRYGNMSSATLMFVLKTILDQRNPGLGCAMAFGPGIAVETMAFTVQG